MLPERRRVLLLGPGSVVHTRRWANGLADAGVDVVCASQHGFGSGPWHADVKRFSLPHSGPMGYVFNARALRALFGRERCDLMHAHYASGYGTLALLAGTHPRLLSVWGSDVYDFPRTSLFHLALLRQTLGRSDALASTSMVMAQQVRHVMGPGWHGKVAVTPFGVDVQRFAPAPGSPTGAGMSRPLVVGTVKTLAPKYGIDTLIRAFAQLAGDAALCEALPAGLRLRLVGEGEQRAELQALAATLGVAHLVEWPGAVPHESVPVELRALDIYVAASRLDSESFGVAVIEASACGVPVVVSRVGGLPEVVLEDRTGLIVPRDDPDALAKALRRVATDESLRQRLGQAGRNHVVENYAWSDSVRGMIALYGQILDGQAATETRHSESGCA